MRFWTYYQLKKVLNQQSPAGWKLSYVWSLSKEKLPYLTGISSNLVVVNDLKDAKIFLKMIFLALSFINMLATVGIYKCILLIDNCFFRLFAFNV